MSDTPPPPSSRRLNSPTPTETVSKKIRRFAVEPVETSTRSSKEARARKVEDVASAVEKKNDVSSKRRFLPEPVETSFKSSKQTGASSTPNEPTTTSIARISPPIETAKPRRKFLPELIEVSRRSKKAGDTKPATLPTDKTDLSPGVPNIYTSAKRNARSALSSKLPTTALEEIPPSVHTTQIPHLPPRRQPSMRPHPNTRRSTRRDSFQPELEDIPSDENSNADSNDDGGIGDSTPSLSGSFGSSDDSNGRLILARTRESCDDRFSGYLLALAAKAAEKQLREQALAAFPNESFHEVVEHFYDREVEGTSDGGSVEGVGLLVEDPGISLEIRRKSTEVGWAAKEMQAHQENLNRQREDETNKKIAAEATKPTFNDPFWTNGITSRFGESSKPVNEGKGADLERMRSAASPPMLGGDLKFRVCPSPKATKFESDQQPDAQPSRSDNGGGLWGGYCVTVEPGENLSPSIQGSNLIQTPHAEREDPFSFAFALDAPKATRNLMPNDESGVKMLAGLDERLQAEIAKSKAEEMLLAEFDDTFVSQVYNYLSLGHPALARQYDEELARISRIPGDELKIDDNIRKAKGYINIAADGPGTADDQSRCARWKALRIYIIEWARQHPSMSKEGATPSAWGVRARRGSWAI